VWEPDADSPYCFSATRHATPIKKIANIESIQTTKYTTEKSVGRKRKWQIRVSLRLEFQKKFVVFKARAKGNTYMLIEEDLVCGSFLLELKLTNIRKILLARVYY
jgi:hypothetical protein